MLLLHRNILQYISSSIICIHNVHKLHRNILQYISIIIAIYCIAIYRNIFPVPIIWYKICYYWIGIYCNIFPVQIIKLYAIHAIYRFLFKYMIQNWWFEGIYCNIFPVQIIWYMIFLLLDRNILQYIPV